MILKAVQAKYRQFGEVAKTKTSWTSQQIPDMIYEFWIELDL